MSASSDAQRNVSRKTCGIYRTLRYINFTKTSWNPHKYSVFGIFSLFYTGIKIPPNPATMIGHFLGFQQRQKSKTSCPSGAVVVQCDRALV
jgi:hypothetical protein